MFDIRIFISVIRRQKYEKYKWKTKKILANYR